MEVNYLPIDVPFYHQKIYSWLLVKKCKKQIYSWAAIKGGGIFYRLSKWRPYSQNLLSNSLFHIQEVLPVKKYLPQDERQSDA